MATEGQVQLYGPAWTFHRISNPNVHSGHEQTSHDKNAKCFIREPPDAKARRLATVVHERAGGEGMLQNERTRGTVDKTREDVSANYDGTRCNFKVLIKRKKKMLYKTCNKWKHEILWNCLLRWRNWKKYLWSHMASYLNQSPKKYWHMPLYFLD